VADVEASSPVHGAAVHERAVHEARDDASELAFAFSGGGARGAYQVGSLRFLAERYPELDVPILTGVSAGALNAFHLANQSGRFAERVEQLTTLWSSLRVQDVFRVDMPSLVTNGLLWIAQLALWGGTRIGPRARGLVDTAPLAATLHRILESHSGELSGIEANLRAGHLRAIAVTTTHYDSGQTVTWCQGRKVEEWDRPQRRSYLTELRIEHALASAALPVFFPAVRIDNEWYGDGAVRLHAPLAPAVHLGAERILAISTRYSNGKEPRPRTSPAPYPQPAQVLGVLLNAIFLDLLDQDAMRLSRINELLAGRPEPHPQNLRPIELVVLRPSRDLAAIAAEYEPDLPRTFRWLLRRLGTREASGNDLLSVLLFQGDYTARLIELGYQDACAREAEIEAIVTARQRSEIG